MIRDTAMSDVSGLVNNLNSEVKGIFDEQINEKLEEAKIKHQELIAIEDESQMAATNYRISVERKEDQLKSQMNDLYSEATSLNESLASKKIQFSMKDTIRGT